MYLFVLLGCGDPAAEREIETLREQVATLEQQVTDLQEQLDQKSADRDSRLDALRERMEQRRKERGVEAVGEPSEESLSSLREAIEDPDQLAKMGRAVPHIGADGEVDGFRLSGIRRGSLLDRLTVRNGDIVHKVSGHSLDSMAAALQAYEAVKNDSELQVEITRRGEPMTLTVPVDSAP